MLTHLPPMVRQQSSSSVCGGCNSTLPLSTPRHIRQQQGDHTERSVAPSAAQMVLLCSTRPRCSKPNPHTPTILCQELIKRRVRQRSQSWLTSWVVNDLTTRQRFFQQDADKMLTVIQCLSIQESLIRFST